jgi:hypothetical protein
MAAAERRGHDKLRASHADREQVINVLKAAFVAGRLTKDEPFVHSRLFRGHDDRRVLDRCGSGAEALP